MLYFCPPRFHSIDEANVAGFILHMYLIALAALRNFVLHRSKVAHLFLKTALEEFVIVILIKTKISCIGQNLVKPNRRHCKKYTWKHKSLLLLKHCFDLQEMDTGYAILLDYS